MQKFTPWEYMLIEVANSFGLDKETYSDRLEWAKDNLDDLESFDGKETYLYDKAVKNIRDVQAGKPTGCLVRFDAVCSGIQLLSVLTSCESGCKATGAIDNEEGLRPNAYLEVEKEMNRLLDSDDTIVLEYAQIKDAVMTACYGSTRVPKKYFKGEQLRAFHTACRIVAPGAFKMLPILKNTWNPNALSHDWIMPDNYHVHIPVIVEEIVDFEIEELNGYSVRSYIKENKPKDFSVSNIANVTHSIDAYLLRTLVRYCNYDKDFISYINDQLTAITLDRSLNDTIIETCELKEKAEKLNLFDLSWLNLINEESSNDIIKLALKEINLLLEYESFEFIPVHDCFGCSPVNMNRLRFYYNYILAKFNQSNILANIVGQLMNEATTIKMFDNDLVDQISNNNYAIN